MEIMNRKLTIMLSQLNWVVGDIQGNCNRMLKEINAQQNIGTDIIIFSELSLTGCPPGDLLCSNDFYELCVLSLQKLQNASQKIAIIIGHPWKENNFFYNALSFFWHGKTLVRYFKQNLSNYIFFNEYRYFNRGKNSCILLYKKYKIGFLISHDLLDECLVNKYNNIDILITISAIPFDHKQRIIPTNILQNYSKKLSLFIVYLNQIGGQDELIFEGESKIFNSSGVITHKLLSFQEDIQKCVFCNNDVLSVTDFNNQLPSIAKLYHALVMSIKDYVKKNNFSNVILGLSGGIDSALTLAIAVDAVGNKNVQAIMMPFIYTSQMSIQNAKKQTNLLNVKLLIISIEEMYNAYIKNMLWLFKECNRNNKNITQENLQARCRAIILMMISNACDALVLSTFNKSEYFIGYNTIYGDMIGGFAVLKDIYKTLVFKLVNYRNSIATVIPANIVTRPPSAELAPNQFDEDIFPPYSIIDKIIENYVEHNKSINQLIDDGFDEKIVYKIITLINHYKYKRRQSPIGPLIRINSFLNDKNYPITSMFK
uniref:Glutamine-dependent NAD(+) synthetase n=1 Tax=Candidatus Aschnera chinzeii TaxID=1485666 RepID=A0AAT9G4K1_9ENTR|nr:MAG: NAD+ synthase [Candidatus Aschnera chinzeii]